MFYIIAKRLLKSVRMNHAYALNVDFLGQHVENQNGQVNPQNEMRPKKSKNGFKSAKNTIYQEQRKQAAEAVKHATEIGNGIFHGNGFSNGIGISNENGFSNGNGISNGNGSFNGNGLSDGHLLEYSNAKDDVRIVTPEMVPKIAERLGIALEEMKIYKVKKTCKTISYKRDRYGRKKEY